MKRRASWFGVLLCMAALIAAPRKARAEATFVLQSIDPAGSGFNDPTPVAPVGGNTGTTVGQQRRLAFEHALSLWGRVLESDVDIVVEASFGPLQCDGGFAVLGQAGPATVELDYVGLEPGVLYPAALADQILGQDLSPGVPDIQATFNGGLPDCFAGYDWYYGLDAAAPADRADLVATVLHEIAHGLGFLTMVDTETGADALFGYTDPYSMHLLDTSAGMHWPELSESARVESARRVRQLVWDGRFANEAAATTLALGSPSMTVTPAIGGLRNAVVDANFGTSLVGGSVSAGIVMGQPEDGCSEVTGVNGSIALLLSGSCNLLDKAYFAETGGARAVLIAHAGAPPPTIDQRQEFVSAFPVGIPVLGISDDDASLLLSGSGTVQLSADGDRRTGTDAEGRLYMFATDGAQGSPVSHFDPIMRPDLQMEPLDSPNVRHDIKVERALLRDLGWATLCGNGQLDGSEECDSGSTNSDTVADACRIDCRRARCGDGVVDSGEECDAIGPGNVQCTSMCRPHRCGDGIVGPGEQCDLGASNSDTAPDACRTSCLPASCGDGVLDSGEACDDALSPGQCVGCMPPAGTGGVSGGGGSAGTGAAPGTGAMPATGATSSGGANAGSGGSSGAAGNGGGTVGSSEDGCGCRLPGHATRRSGVVPLLLALGLLWRRRFARQTSVMMASR